MISTNQISYVSALLTAALSDKKAAGVDYTQADWTAVCEFMKEQGYSALYVKGYDALNKLGVELPATKEMLKFRMSVTDDLIRFGRELNHLRKFCYEWQKAGRVVLALGGLGFADCYPSTNQCGATEVPFMTLYRDAESFKGHTEKAERYTAGPWTLIPADKAVGDRSDKREGEMDSQLQEAFHAGQCKSDNYFGFVKPSPLFRALYHLYHCQEQLLAGSLPFRSVVDWALLLRHLAAQPEAFDWADLWTRAEAMGLANFCATLTALGQRLTGVELPEAAVRTTAQQDDADVLLDYILNPVGEEKSGNRFGRFVGVLRNSKRYSRFTDISVVGEAFRQLFSQE